MDSPKPIPSTIREWIIRKKPANEKVTKEHFSLRTVSLNDQQVEGKILVKIVYISNDPAQRTWMDDGPFNDRPYLPPVMQEGVKVFAGTVAEVIETYGTTGFTAGEMVFGYFGWADYALVDPNAGAPIEKIPPTIKPEEFHCLSLSGRSAYFAFFRRAEATKSMRTVVVNAAAGAVGSMVTQFAKNIIGIERVIGICGSNEKCRIIKEKCGVDIALNYKSPNFEPEFIAATPDYIDLLFDNVGGKQLDLGIKRIAPMGKVLSCGAVSHYERDEVSAVSGSSWMQIIYQQATILGFLVVNYLAETPEAVRDMSKWAQEGKIELLRSVYEASLEEVPDAYRFMLEGKGVGKLITKLK